MNSNLLTRSLPVSFSVVEALQCLGYYNLHKCTLPSSLARLRGMV